MIDKKTGKQIIELHPLNAKVDTCYQEAVQGISKSVRLAISEVDLPGAVKFFKDMVLKQSASRDRLADEIYSECVSLFTLVHVDWAHLGIWRSEKEQLNKGTEDIGNAAMGGTGIPAQEDIADPGDFIVRAYSDDEEKLSLSLPKKLIQKAIDKIAEQPPGEYRYTIDELNGDGEYSQGVKSISGVAALKELMEQIAETDE